MNLEERDLNGQWREDERQPLVIDASRPMLMFLVTTTEDSVEYHAEYSMIVDPNTLERRLYGLAALKIPLLGGSLGTATLVPDMDGDGMEDFVIGYVAIKEDSSDFENVVDYFLTGDRPTVSVAETPTPLVETNCTLSDLAPAYVYNVLGEQIAVVDIVNNTVAPYQLELLPQQPLWVVQGECVERVQ